MQCVGVDAYIDPCREAALRPTGGYIIRPYGCSGNFGRYVGVDAHIDPTAKRPMTGGSESRPYGCVQNQAVKRMRIAAARFDCKTLTTSFRHLSFPFLGVMACISLGFGQIVLRNSLQLL